MLTFGVLVLGVTDRQRWPWRYICGGLLPADCPPAHRQRPAGRRLLALTLVLITHDALP